MTSPNIVTVAASLERSIQSFSLDQTSEVISGSNEGKKKTPSSSSSSSSSTSDAAATENHFLESDITLELNSNLSLPSNWEQCLDLKTGDIYYINWKTGMKSKEDPRFSEEFNGEFYSEVDDNSLYDSEESSSESSSPPSFSRKNNLNNNNKTENHQNPEKEEIVLVVAGCKCCLMYFMVPREDEDCHKCGSQLLHF